MFVKMTAVSLFFIVTAMFATTEAEAQVTIGPGGQIYHRSGPQGETLHRYNSAVYSQPVLITAVHRHTGQTSRFRGSVIVNPRVPSINTPNRACQNHATNLAYAYNHCYVFTVLPYRNSRQCLRY